VTAFTFPGHNLGWALSSFDWLVVSGPIAYCQGTCKLNGRSGYRFLVAAQDGSRNATDKKNRIRIRIWNIASGQVIYDTQPGAALDTLPTLALGGGLIAIR
jgi:hypothetical protein